MKKCPACGNLFDPSNEFCPNDGSRLVMNSFQSAEQPTIVAPIRPMVPGTKPAQSTSPILYVSIGVLATGLVAALIFIFAIQGRDQEAQSSNGANKTAESSETSAKPTAVPSPSIDPNFSPRGTWNGSWVHFKGTSRFSARVELQESGGQVDGKIFWTLEYNANPEKSYKVGLTAIEYVRGSFDPVSRKVNFGGYRVDDPNNIIRDDDRYNLTLSPNKASMSGTSKNGNFKLSR